MRKLVILPVLVLPRCCIRGPLRVPHGVVFLSCVQVVYAFHRFAIWDVRFSPLVASYFVSASKDALCCIWCMSSSKPHRVLTGHCGDVNVRACFFPSISFALPVVVARMELGMTPGVSRCSLCAQCCLIHPNGMYVLTGSLDTTLRVWDIVTGDELMVLTGHSSSITALCVSPDGRYVASGALDWTVRVWDLKDLTVLRVLSGHSEVRAHVRFVSCLRRSGGCAPPPCPPPPPTFASYFAAD